eukprot:5939934-Prymnesium_polylepis.1
MTSCELYDIIHRTSEHVAQRARPRPPPNTLQYPSTRISGGVKSARRASLVDAGPACPLGGGRSTFQAGDPLVVTRKGPGRNPGGLGPFPRSHTGRDA